MILSDVDTRRQKLWLRLQCAWELVPLGCQPDSRLSVSHIEPSDFPAVNVGSRLETCDLRIMSHVNGSPANPCQSVSYRIDKLLGFRSSITRIANLARMCKVLVALQLQRWGLSRYDAPWDAARHTEAPWASPAPTPAACLAARLPWRAQGRFCAPTRWQLPYQHSAKNKSECTHFAVDRAADARII